VSYDRCDAESNGVETNAKRDLLRSGYQCGQLAAQCKKADGILFASWPVDVLPSPRMERSPGSSCLQAATFKGRRAHFPNVLLVRIAVGRLAWIPTLHIITCP